MTRARARVLADGRLHLHDGPIDLIILACGAPRSVTLAYAAGQRRFATILDELCSELTVLREPTGRQPRGTIANSMWQATSVHAQNSFITPMAAVAGAVAEAVLAAMTGSAPLDRAAVNNGGDIALHLGPGTSFSIGLIDRPDRPCLFGEATIRAESPVRGIATSGWRGRSFSLGIADAVTVLAARAAQADAAATVIANAVDLPGHPAIIRVPACDIQPDSDLGSRLVTRGVGPLLPGDIDTALGRGLNEARRLAEAGVIADCALHLSGKTRSLGSEPVWAVDGGVVSVRRQSPMVTA